ncbi:MAG: serine/threonine protein kinase, partial [Planctomycetota bacterium]
MKCELVIAKGPDAEQRFVIAAEGELLLGRGEDCSVRLRDPSVSRHQCRIRLEADRVTLIDLSSRWGTLVNGRSIKEGELKSGDHITLGDTEIIVLLSSLADDTTLPPRTRPALDQDPTAEFPRPIIAESFAPPALPKTAKATAPTKKKSPKLKPPAPTTQPPSHPGFHPPPAVVDRQFGELKLESVVAIGRTGIVYASTNLESGEKLAVKIFYPEVLPVGEARDRFVRAMRTMINVRHDNLVRLYRAGSQRGVCYTVSEFIEGRSAAQLLAASNGAGLDWRSVRHIARGIASALQFAFQNNFVHRNVTPSNILIRESDQAVKLGDLALAKALIGANAFDVTRTNSVLGQLPYLSPEQIEHSPGQNHLS